MCGVAVVVGLSRQQGMALSERMAGSMTHRGPDSSADIFCPWAESEPDGVGVALSHRRLAILDKSPAGNQPMSDSDGRFVISYNGEIYNHLELRGQYLKDQRFRSTSDTETILELWKKLGPSALQIIRGIFAFVLVDNLNQEVHVVRDRLGIKPLYWAQIPGTPGLAIASELRAIINAGFLPRKFSHDAVESFLAHGSVIGPLTIHRDVVEILPASHWILRSNGRPSSRTFYWQWPSVDSRLTDEEAIERCRSLLFSAVSENLLADVPVGIFLSGGMDSSAVGVLASRAAGSQIIGTMTLDFQFPGFSEAAAARQAAEVIRSNHCSVPIDENYFADQFGPALDAWDQPSKDGLNTYLVSTVAKSLGLTVVLSGLGGDEVFCGYKCLRGCRALIACGERQRLSRSRSESN